MELLQMTSDLKSNNKVSASSWFQDLSYPLTSDKNKCSSFWNIFFCEIQLEMDILSVQTTWKQILITHPVTYTSSFSLHTVEVCIWMFTQVLGCWLYLTTSDRFCPCSPCLKIADRLLSKKNFQPGDQDSCLPGSLAKRLVTVMGGVL